MEKFKVKNHQKLTIIRSIRLSEATLQKLVTVSKVAGVSVNKIISQCIDFSLENMGI